MTSVWYGQITHDDGYVASKPLAIAIIGNTAQVEFTWDYLADGATNVPSSFKPFSVVAASGASMHLTSSKVETDEDYNYYSTFRDGTWYNKRGTAVGTFSWTAGPPQPRCKLCRENYKFSSILNIATTSQFR